LIKNTILGLGMEDRPKLKVPLSVGDKVLESVGWLALIGVWVLVVFNHQQLTGKIPIHFNAAGDADRFGGKVMFFRCLSLP
jgi:hypothetical protein